jgi:hypothetical protein
MFRAHETKPLEDLLRELDEEATLSADLTQFAHNDDEQSPASAVAKLDDDLDAAPTPDPVRVPVAAVQDERSKRRTAEEENAELRARLAQYEEASNTQQPPAPQRDPRDDIRAEIATKDSDVLSVRKQRDELLLALASRKDDGELTEVEYTRQFLDINNKAQELLDKHSKERDDLRRRLDEPTPQEIERIIAADTRLADETAKLEQANPWFAAIPQKAIGTIINDAVDALQREGFRLDASFQSNLRLRQLAVEIAARDYGYDKLAAPTTTNGSSAPAAQPQSPDNGMRREIMSASGAYTPPTPPNTQAHGYAGVTPPQGAGLGTAANASSAMSNVLSEYTGQTLEQKLNALGRDLETL